VGSHGVAPPPTPGPTAVALCIRAGLQGPVTCGNCCPQVLFAAELRDFKDRAPPSAGKNPPTPKEKREAAKERAAQKKRRKLEVEVEVEVEGGPGSAVAAEAERGDAG
jgi:hypothetical protein